MATHTPVQASPAKRTPLVRERLDIDADLRTELAPARGQFQRRVLSVQKTTALKAVEHQHTKFTRKMVVADTGLS
jgi:hypothetical protein